MASKEAYFFKTRLSTRLKGVLTEGRREYGEGQKNGYGCKGY